VDRHAGEVLFQHSLRFLIYLTEGHRFDSSDHPSRKRESADATEQIKMLNKALDGTPRTFHLRSGI
jgi:hypothetical protein